MILPDSAPAELGVEALRRKLDRARRAREQAEALLETRATELRARTVWLEEATARLAASRQHLQAVLDAAQEAILVFDDLGRIHDVNLACEKLFRFNPDEMSGLTLDRLIPKLSHNFSDVLREAMELAQNGSVFRRDALAQTAGATVVPVSLVVRPIESGDGHEARFVALITDRSREASLHARLRQAVAQEQQPLDPQDVPLFHLSTHRALRDWYEEAVEAARAARQPCSAVIVCANLDRFKRVNHTLGLDAGDAVIDALTGRIHQFLTQSPPAPGARMAFCRLYADHFVIAAVAPGESISLEAWSHALRTHLGEPLESYAQRFVFSVSVGSAMAGVEDADFQRLSIEAEWAMKRVKLQGGNGYLAHAGGRDRLAPRLMATEHNVILGIERREFRPHFQPKVSARTGEVVGFEALLRWQHPQRGLIPLGEFLPVLQNSSLMLEVGLQIFEQMLATLAQWQSLGCELPVSFNLSNGELLSADFRQRMAALARQYHVPPARIGLEITETVVAHLGDTGDAIFDELIRAGFRLSMDDFGVGTSSLGRIRSIPLSEIKVDKSFASAIDRSLRDRDLLFGIVHLARSLGLAAVIEGIETEAQCRVARETGDVVIQGFYFSQAVDADQALALVRAGPYPLP